MSRFTPETIERVREAADIVEIVSAYTDLRRQGERFVGLCPFHDERTPSFSVKPREASTTASAARPAATRSASSRRRRGSRSPTPSRRSPSATGSRSSATTEDPQAEEARRRRGRLGEALERVAAFYEAFLWESPKAAKARAYLTEERGLGEEVLRELRRRLRAERLGFDPDPRPARRLLGRRAARRGLIQRSQNTPGSHYDRFRARIAFPVRDHRGRVVGFGARGMGPDAKPKYLNSPESEVYRKSRTLYGIDRARGPIARGGRAVVVEGYTDVLALHGAGVEETVAVMGTAITPDQLKLLGSYAEEVVLALDADRAGREAMLRAQRVAGSGRLRLMVAAMPEGEDPADMLLAEDGSSRLREALAGAVDLAVFHARAILGDADLSTPPGRDRALDEVVPVLVGMGETITRQEMVREVADRLDAPPDLIAGRMRSGGRAPAPVAAGPAGTGSAQPPAPQRPRREPTRRSAARRKMLGALPRLRPRARRAVRRPAHGRALHLADPGRGLRAAARAPRRSARGARRVGLGPDQRDLEAAGARAGDAEAREPGLPLDASGARSAGPPAAAARRARAGRAGQRPEAAGGDRRRDLVGRASWAGSSGSRPSGPLT